VCVDCTQVRDEGGCKVVNLYSARICKRVRERKIPTRETKERKEDKGERRRREGWRWIQLPFIVWREWGGWVRVRCLGRGRGKFPSRGGTMRPVLADRFPAWIWIEANRRSMHARLGQGVWRACVRASHSTCFSHAVAGAPGVSSPRQYAAKRLVLTFFACGETLENGVVLTGTQFKVDARLVITRRAFRTGPLIGWVPTVRLDK
jgi:hypothetical protein